MAPTVISTTPQDLATNVPPDANPTVTFSAPMEAATINLGTFKVFSTLVDGGVTLTDGGVTLNDAGTTATFVPSFPLGENLVYTAKVTTGARAAGGLALAENYTWTFTTTPLWLGTAQAYSVLGSTVTNTGSTTLSADLGVPNAGTIAQGVSLKVGGATHVGGAEVTQALLDLQAAYADAAAPRPNTTTISGVLNGQTLHAGVYNSAAALSLLAASTTLTLDGDGNPNAAFIFQVGGALTPAASISVILTNGTKASNVFWQVNGAVVLAATSHFVGTILGNAAVTVDDSTSLEGRALTFNGAVTLTNNTIGWEISDGGYGSLTGSSAFTVKACRAFAGLLGDGGADWSRVRVDMASVDYPCQDPTSISGPRTALTLKGYSSAGGQGKGTFVSNGANTSMVDLNPDGGEPVGVAIADAGSFTIQWDADPTKADPTNGVTGTMNVLLGDGGTILGTFAASYCGAYP